MNPRLPAAARRVVHAALAVSLLGGCATETLFQSSFNASPVGSVPPAAQAVGTLSLAGDPGSVVIVAPLPGTSENWAKISRAGAQSAITTVIGDFSQFRGPGTYTLLCSMFLPSGSGAATVEFDTSPFGSPAHAGFLHLDFMPNNTVRIDDNASQVFGTFPRDQYFSLAVTLDITASTAVAHMSIFGNGASGNKDYNVTLPSLASQIGAVRFWMGFPWTGSFDVTDIHVLHKTS